MRVKLYHFDEVDEQLELVPLAARRALDRAGLKLSLAAWRSLPLPSRRAITQTGSMNLVDIPTVIAEALHADPVPTEIEPRYEPPPDAAPAEILSTFGNERPITPAVWAALVPLDRYALAKVAERGNPERVTAAYQEIIGASAFSSHLGPGGGVRMVDVSHKLPTLRRAVAESRVCMNREALDRLLGADAPKGDVLGAARLAGIMAAKRTSEIVPLCHLLALSHVSVELDTDLESRSVTVTATVEAIERTGVEMEALVAASAAALTIYDMLKAFDRAMEIGPTRLLFKSGGRTGDFVR